MLTPTRLTIQGFRGFREVEEFHFDAPSTHLFGENRSCKSSTLNAMEWALYGSEGVMGKQTGIRERVGWIIQNKYAPATDACVELELNGPNGVYVIRRSLRQSQRKASSKEALQVTLPDGGTVSDGKADEFLAGLLKSSFRDFLTTVYQHQESIRAVLTQEPKDRSDAIDRLLGLSSRRNLLGALDAANLRSRQRENSKRFVDFEGQIQTALATRERDLAELRKEAQDAGMGRSQLTAKEAIQWARTVAESIREFARAAELDVPELTVPEEWTHIVEFDKVAKKNIGDLRGQVPGIAEQRNLLGGQKTLLALQASLHNLDQRWAALNMQILDFDKVHGSAEAVSIKMAAATEEMETAQERLRKTSARAAVVNEAIGFMESEDQDAPCPVCGSEVPSLREKLQQLWIEKLQGLVQGIAARIEELRGQLKELRAVAGRYEKISESVERLLDEKATLREQAAELLLREVTPQDDAAALVAGELSRLDRRLQELAQTIKERQERLDLIEQNLAKVRLIRNYLHLEAKGQVLEAIRKSDAFTRLETLRDEIALLVEDVEAIKSAIATAAREEGEAKLTAAEVAIDEYFRQLSRHPAVERIKLDIATDKRTQRNAYEITDQDGNDLTPVLSQGDLNALALAIFLGLATTATEDSIFGCILMDDPSQSLGTEHKKELAGLLDEVARYKKLIVATMDPEFHQYMMERITKTKTVYQFGEWTPEGGPTITADRSANCNGNPACGGLARCEPRN